MKFPFIKFFPTDWLAEASLRACSVGARGLWMDMLSLMHMAPRRGYLLAATGLPISPEQLARMTGCTADEVNRLLEELRTSGAFSCTADGMIYSRRMVREEAKRDLCAEAGRRGGGNPTFKGRPKGADKGGPKGGDKPLDARCQTPNPTGGAAAEPPPPVADVPAAPPRERKPPSGLHAEAIRFFVDSWAERYGDKYPFDGGKDAAAVKAMLAHVGDDLGKFRAVVTRYFANSEPFFSGHRLSLLRSQLAKFLVDAPPPARRSGGFQTHDDRVMGDIFEAIRDQP